MRVIYISHPIAGDMKANIERVETIIRALNLSFSTIFPYAHYLVECRVLRDSELSERERGMKNNAEVFKRRFIDELWLYGTTISPGMVEEIKLAQKYDIPIKCKTPETRASYLSLQCSYVIKSK